MCKIIFEKMKTKEEKISETEREYEKAINIISKIFKDELDSANAEIADFILSKKRIKCF